ncbi:hypothetical protein G6L99_08270 [Agrobacterium rhizogenes]|uniref:hypothetical protein n=1 Tax=Rhizobium rhizogenes TaxID=359 RepID=UPI001572AF99|nr:hypothetical protein [Rhizobium rhizogenes]NTH12103.1 hypothetical protein [Rhizobium rhizogenes]
MFWKLFAICIVYAQLDAIVTAYSGLQAATPFGLINWVLSFPVVVAVCCYVFKFPVGKRNHWHIFSWFYSAYSIALALKLGHDARGWFYRFPDGDDPVGTCVRFATIVSVLFFKWIAVWRYGHDEAAWTGASAVETPSTLDVRYSCATTFGMLRRYRSLQFYVGVFAVLMLVFMFNRVENPGASYRSLYEALGPVGYFYTMKSIHGLLLIMGGFCVVDELATLRRRERRVQQLAPAVAVNVT